MALPSLPPAFQLVGLDREVPAFERAVRLAPRGLDDGTVYWTDRADRLELAMALEPEAPPARSLEAVYELSLAAGAALADHLPPAIPVAFAWPGDVLLDGARLGRVRAAVAPIADPAAVPPWLVLGLTLDLASLREKAVSIAAVPLAESVCRQFLRWTSHRRVDGLEPVREAWNRRCFRRGEIHLVALPGARVEGVVAGLDGDGAFRVGGRALWLHDALELLA